MLPLAAGGGGRRAVRGDREPTRRGGDAGMGAMRRDRDATGERRGGSSADRRSGSREAPAERRAPRRRDGERGHRHRADRLGASPGSRLESVTGGALRLDQKPFRSGSVRQTSPRFFASLLHWFRAQRLPRVGGSPSAARARSRWRPPRRRRERPPSPRSPRPVRTWVSAWAARWPRWRSSRRPRKPTSRSTRSGPKGLPSASPRWRRFTCPPRRNASSWRNRTAASTTRRRSSSLRCRVERATRASRRRTSRLWRCSPTKPRSARSKTWTRVSRRSLA